MSGSTGTQRTRLEPSPWVVRWLSLAATASNVLDVACGTGRHTIFAANLGHRVVALDRNPEALEGLRNVERVRTLEADIEEGPWPLANQTFDAVLVTNYLHRPLFDSLVRSLTESGLLIYETFARGNERFGRPSKPEFLLEPGELYERVSPSLRVIGYEDLFVASPKPAMVQRICACGPRFRYSENTR